MPGRSRHNPGQSRENVVHAFFVFCYVGSGLPQGFFGEQFTVGTKNITYRQIFSGELTCVM